MRARIPRVRAVRRRTVPQRVVRVIVVIPRQRRRRVRQAHATHANGVVIPHLIRCRMAVGAASAPAAAAANPVNVPQGAVVRARRWHARHASMPGRRRLRVQH
eukprot:116919-Chlamydomonas_euryale.AAC.1